MSDYYKVEATLSEPPSPSPPPPSRGQPKSTHPHVGKRSKNPKPSSEVPTSKKPSAESPDGSPEREPSPPSTQQPPSTWQPYETKSTPELPPPYAENGEKKAATPTLKPAKVNPEAGGRCGSCGKILRRLFPIALLFSYTMLGGIIFHLIESTGQSESEVLKGHLVLIDQPAALQLEKRMTEIVLDQNYTRARRTYEVREALLWYLRKLNEEEKARWTFAAALFYSMTLYTTIGYGDTPPKTTSGRVLTVIYSIIGIPLCLAALIELGDLIGLLFSKSWSCIRHGWTAARRRRRRHNTAKSGHWEALPTSETPNEQRENEAQDDADLLSFPLSALVLLTFFWLLFTALLFYAWESAHNWTYAQSLYFTFISFTTIGLGDFVPASTSGKLVGILFLLVGLALLSTTIAVLQQQLAALQNAMQREIDAAYQESQSDTGAPMTTDEREMDAGLKKMASKLSLGSRLLFAVMPESRKKNLKQYYKQKAAMLPKSIQTDDYLWAMTHMSKSLLRKASEGHVRGVPGEIVFTDATRSRDDVNSLVALCDYSLPQEYSEHKDYDF